MKKWIKSVVLLAALLVLITIPIYFPMYRPAFYKAIFMLLSILLAADIAMKRYHHEQRTLRIQKLYFEDTLLGLSKMMETIMAQSTRNMFIVESVVNLGSNILRQNNITLEEINEKLNMALDNAIQDINSNFDSADFKKETLSNLLYDSKKTHTRLPTWIDRLQKDSYRFSLYLQQRLVLLKLLISKLDACSIHNFNGALDDIGLSAQDNYFLINRHYILFSLFSELNLVFCSENYETIKSMLKALKKDKVKTIIKLLNQSYEALVAGFDQQEIEIGKINKDQTRNLKEKIAQAQEAMRKLICLH